MFDSITFDSIERSGGGMILFKSVVFFVCLLGASRDLIVSVSCPDDYQANEP